MEQTIGAKIRELRKARGLTQKELGERAGIAEPTIRRYELGKLNPKFETVQKQPKGKLKASFGQLKHLQGTTGSRGTFRLIIKSESVSF